MSDSPAMIDLTLLAILRCPRTGSELSQALPADVDAANRRIAAGELRDASDQKVTEPLAGALVTRCGTWMYAIRDQIPAMIPEEAIRAEQLRT